MRKYRVITFQLYAIEKEENLFAFYISESRVNYKITFLN